MSFGTVQDNKMQEALMCWVYMEFTQNFCSKTFKKLFTSKTKKDDNTAMDIRDLGYQKKGHMKQVQCHAWWQDLAQVAYNLHVPLHNC
jgi:hypothetical protein